MTLQCHPTLLSAKHSALDNFSNAAFKSLVRQLWIATRPRKAVLKAGLVPE